MDSNTTPDLNAFVCPNGVQKRFLDNPWTWLGQRPRAIRQSTSPGNELRTCSAVSTKARVPGLVEALAGAGTGLAVRRQRGPGGGPKSQRPGRIGQGAGFRTV
jgi:hypothetical protein